MVVRTFCWKTNDDVHSLLERKMVMCTLLQRK